MLFFLYSELTILRDLSLGYTDPNKIKEYALNHVETLKQAMLSELPSYKMKI